MANRISAPPLTKSKLIYIVIHFHLSNLALCLETACSVLLFRIFFLSYLGVYLVALFILHNIKWKLGN